MNTAERRQYMLNLLTSVLPAITPALVELLVPREKEKPVREHRVVAYPVSGDALLTPPDGDGWELVDFSLVNMVGHWTRVIYPVTASDTLPPDADYTEPDASTEPFIGPEAPLVCALCGAFEGRPHDSGCTQEMRDHAALSGPIYVKRTPKQ
jgi:hypothetical protein